MIEIETGLGSHISVTVKEAIELAKQKNDIVHFEFNGTDVYVNEYSKEALVERDFMDHYKLGTTSIGPTFDEEYDEETLEKIRLYDEERERKEAIYEEESRIQKEKALAEVTELTKSASMEFADEAGWNDWKSKNTDPYGAGIFEYAQYWAELMQATAIDKGIEIDEHFMVTYASELSHKADISGITGFMYGAAVSILSKTWKYGEPLRKWHNGEYGQPDTDGVVNPAVLTIGAK